MINNFNNNNNNSNNNNNNNNLPQNANSAKSKFPLDQFKLPMVSAVEAAKSYEFKLEQRSAESTTAYNFLSSIVRATQVASSPQGSASRANNINNNNNNNNNSAGNTRQEQTREQRNSNKRVKLFGYEEICKSLGIELTQALTFPIDERQVLNNIKFQNQDFVAMRALQQQTDSNDLHRQKQTRLATLDPNFLADDIRDDNDAIPKVFLRDANGEVHKTNVPVLNVLRCSLIDSSSLKYLDVEASFKQPFNGPKPLLTLLNDLRQGHVAPRSFFQLFVDWGQMFIDEKVQREMIEEEFEFSFNDLYIRNIHALFNTFMYHHSDYYIKIDGETGTHRRFPKTPEQKLHSARVLKQNQEDVAAGLFKYGNPLSPMTIQHVLEKGLAQLKIFCREMLEKQEKKKDITAKLFTPGRLGEPFYNLTDSDVNGRVDNIYSRKGNAPRKFQYCTLLMFRCEDYVVWEGAFNELLAREQHRELQGLVDVLFKWNDQMFHHDPQYDPKSKPWFEHYASVQWKHVFDWLGTNPNRFGLPEAVFINKLSESPCSQLRELWGKFPRPSLSNMKEFKKYVDITNAFVRAIDPASSIGSATSLKEFLKHACPEAVEAFRCFADGNENLREVIEAEDDVLPVDSSSVTQEDIARSATLLGEFAPSKQQQQQEFASPAAVSTATSRPSLVARDNTAFLKNNHTLCLMEVGQDTADDTFNTHQEHEMLERTLNKKKKSASRDNRTSSCETPTHEDEARSQIAGFEIKSKNKKSSSQPQNIMLLDDEEENLLELSNTQLVDNEDDFDHYKLSQHSNSSKTSSTKVSTTPANFLDDDDQLAHLGSTAQARRRQRNEHVHGTAPSKKKRIQESSSSEDDDDDASSMEDFIVDDNKKKQKSQK